MAPHPSMAVKSSGFILIRFKPWTAAANCSTSVPLNLYTVWASAHSLPVEFYHDSPEFCKLIYCFVQARCHIIKLCAFLCGKAAVQLTCGFAVFHFAKNHTFQNIMPIPRRILKNCVLLPILIQAHTSSLTDMISFRSTIFTQCPSAML